VTVIELFPNTEKFAQILWLIGMTFGMMKPHIYNNLHDVLPSNLTLRTYHTRCIEPIITNTTVTCSGSNQGTQAWEI